VLLHQEQRVANTVSTGGILRTNAHDPDDMPAALNHLWRIESIKIRGKDSSVLLTCAVLITKLCFYMQESKKTN
jgi:hypothetical protein